MFISALDGAHTHKGGVSMVKKAFAYDVTGVLEHLNPNLVETSGHRCLYELLSNKEDIQSQVSWSHARGKGLIVDMKARGVIWSFDHDLFEAIVRNKALWLRRRDSQDWIRVYTSLPDHVGLEKVGARMESLVNSRGYRYIYFKAEYRYMLPPSTSLSQHTIILAFHLGVDVLKTLGRKGRLHEIHHKDRDKQNNSPRNLVLLTIKEHRAIHRAEFWY